MGIDCGIELHGTNSFGSCFSCEQVEACTIDEVVGTVHTDSALGTASLVGELTILNQEEVTSSCMGVSTYEVYREQWWKEVYSQDTLNTSFATTMG